MCQASNASKENQLEISRELEHPHIIGLRRCHDWSSIINPPQQLIQALVLVGCWLGRIIIDHQPFKVGFFQAPGIGEKTSQDPWGHWCFCEKNYAYQCLPKNIHYPRFKVSTGFFPDVLMISNWKNLKVKSKLFPSDYIKMNQIIYRISDISEHVISYP